MSDDSHDDIRKPSETPADAVESRTESPSRPLNGSQGHPSPVTATKVKIDESPAQPKVSWRYTFSSLSNRDFLFLFLGMVAMMGGMQMQMLARGYLAYDLTGSASILGVVSVGFAVPMLFLSLFGGAIADRIERKRLIQLGQLVPALMALGIAFGIRANAIDWYHLFIASLIQGSMFSFMMPARQAIIPQLVGGEKLSNAMALNSAGMSAMTLISPAIAGGLYAWTGPSNVYFAIAALGFSSVVLTTFVPKTGTGTGKAKKSMLSDIGAGLSYVRKSPLVMTLIVMGLGTAMLAMPFRALLPVFVVDIYHREADSMGLLIAIMGGGSLIGSLFIASLGKWKRGLLLIIGSFMSGIALLLIATIPLYYVAAVVMLLLGLGDAGRRTLNQSLVMEVTEDQYRGRVMSVFMMNFGLMPLAVLPIGVLIDAIGGQLSIGILAAVLLGFSAIILLTQSRLRNLA